MDFQTASTSGFKTGLNTGFPGEMPLPPSHLSGLQPALSVDKIRAIRNAFEQENQYLQQYLGPQEHQSLMTAMYETTEHFLNKKVNDFEIVEHLEFVKMTAQDLHNRGVSLDEFQSELMRESQDSVFKILQKA